MMSRMEPPARRDQENPDPQELNRPVPKLFLVLVLLLVAWAVYYIAMQAPGLGSSSAPRKEQRAAVGSSRAG